MEKVKFMLYRAYVLGHGLPQRSAAFEPGPASVVDVAFGRIDGGVAGVIPSDLCKSVSVCVRRCIGGNKEYACCALLNVCSIRCRIIWNKVFLMSCV